jgi:hypothetical protein
LPPKWCEVQVCVDHHVDAGQVEAGLRDPRNQAWIHVGHGRVQLRHAGVDKHSRVGMVDDVHVDGHPLAVGEQVGHEDRGDRRRRDVGCRSVACLTSSIRHGGPPVHLPRRWRGRR